MSTPIDPSRLPAIPAKARQAIYGLYGLAVIAAGAADAAYADADPDWLIATLRVLTYLAVPVAAIAVVNVQQTPAERARDAA